MIDGAERNGCPLQMRLRLDRFSKQYICFSFTRKPMPGTQCLESQHSAEKRSRLRRLKSPGLHELSSLATLILNSASFSFCLSTDEINMGLACCCLVRLKSYDVARSQLEPVIFPPWPLKAGITGDIKQQKLSLYLPRRGVRACLHDHARVLEGRRSFFTVEGR